MGHTAAGDVQHRAVVARVAIALDGAIGALAGQITRGVHRGLAAHVHAAVAAGCHIDAIADIQHGLIGRGVAGHAERFAADLDAALGLGGIHDTQGALGQIEGGAQLGGHGIARQVEGHVPAVINADGARHSHVLQQHDGLVVLRRRHGIRQRGIVGIADLRHGVAPLGGHGLVFSGQLEHVAIGQQFSVVAMLPAEEHLVGLGDIRQLDAGAVIAGYGGLGGILGVHSQAVLHGELSAALNRIKGHGDGVDLPLRLQGNGDSHRLGGIISRVLQLPALAGIALAGQVGGNRICGLEGFALRHIHVGILCGLFVVNRKLAVIAVEGDGNGLDDVVVAIVALHSRADQALGHVVTVDVIGIAATVGIDVLNSVLLQRLFDFELAIEDAAVDGQGRLVLLGLGAPDVILHIAVDGRAILDGDRDALRIVAGRAHVEGITAGLRGDGRAVADHDIATVIGQGIGPVARKARAVQGHIFQLQVAVVLHQHRGGPTGGHSAVLQGDIAALLKVEHLADRARRANQLAAHLVLKAVQVDGDLLGICRRDHHTVAGDYTAGSSLRIELDRVTVLGISDRFRQGGIVGRHAVPGDHRRRGRARISRPVGLVADDGNDFRRPLVECINTVFIANLGRRRAIIGRSLAIGNLTTLQ